MKVHYLLMSLFLIYSTANAETTATPDHILPNSLSGKQSIELGDIIYSAMPDQGQDSEWGWDWQANNPNFIWGAGMSKNGFAIKMSDVRMNVMGSVVASTAQKQYEFGSEVNLTGSDDPESGPSEIEISMPLACYSLGYENCSFVLPPSLDRKNISVRKVCHGQSEKYTDDTYILSADGKQSILATLELYKTSGIAATRLVLNPYTNMSDAENVCAENNEVTKNETLSKNNDHKKNTATLGSIQPKSLTGKESFELGDIIYLAMPDKGQGPAWAWDWQANNPNFIWQDDLSKESSTENKIESNVTYSVGDVRINVMGNVFAVPGQEKIESGWKVALVTDENFKFGPKELNIAPPVKCGNFGYDECSYELLPSLHKRGITADRVCHQKIYGYTSDTYILSAQGKESIIATLSDINDSRGANTKLMLSRYTDASDLDLICGNSENIVTSTGVSDQIKALSKEELNQQSEILYNVLRRVINNSAISDAANKEKKICHIRIFVAHQMPIEIDASSEKTNDHHFCSQVIDVLSNIKIFDVNDESPIGTRYNIN